MKIAILIQCCEKTSMQHLPNDVSFSPSLNRIKNIQRGTSEIYNTV